MPDLKKLYDSVVSGDAKTTQALTQQALAEGVDPLKLVNDYMVPAMDEVGRRFEANEYFVPELLISARAMKAALELIRPLLTARGDKPVGRVAIGTVKGDLHDIGKNLVASLLEGGGFEVIDLGVNVTPEKFIATVNEKQANIVAMSALLTTTMPSMKTTIEALKQAGVRDKVKVLIGGAPITQKYADEIGADGYSENAVGAVALAKKAVAGPPNRRGPTAPAAMHPLIQQLVSQGPVITDGAWGTELQARGLELGEFPDLWNLTHPERVGEVAQAYVEAGSQVILTNTFGATRIRLAEHAAADRVAEVNARGVEISRKAAGSRARVFASIGPTGKLLMSGEVTADELRAAFTEQARALAQAHPDALVIETMSDLEEASLAVSAARETGLPVVACMVFDSGKDKDRTMMGTTPEQAARALTEAGADVIGANCGQGIAGFLAICRRLHGATDRPVWIKANAGLPTMVDGRAEIHHDTRGVQRLHSRPDPSRRELYRRLLRHCDPISSPPSAVFYTTAKRGDGAMSNEMGNDGMSGLLDCCRTG